MSVQPATPSPAQAHTTLPELVRLINDDLAAGLRSETSNHVLPETDGGREEIGRYICIELAGNQMAIPLSAVLEAGELQLVHPLPLLPDWISGITNIRGEIVSVVDLARFLRWTDRPPTGRQAFLIVHDESIKISVTVDRIIGTRALYRSPGGGEEQGPATALPAALLAGRALYRAQDSEMEIDLFDLDTFLSSQKLRSITGA